jgi:signal transduction histidine kinase
VAGSATFVATAVTNSIFVLDGTPLAAFLLFVLVQAGLALSRRWSSTAQPSLHRAARDEQISDMRFKIEVKAAAIMHDTVLNHLAAIANAPDGPLRPEMRLQVDRDLEVLVGEEWLLDAESGTDAETGSEWRQSKLFKVVDEVRQLGLHIDVSGDVVAVGRLGVDRATAVALATKQCLVNVLNHSGTDRAELVVYGSDREVSVMVIDTGVGFMEDETGADRLGLRHSVRRRIETVGGTVQVWSTPGKGTSVMIRVPALAPEIDVFVPTELEPT